MDFNLNDDDDFVINPIKNTAYLEAKDLYIECIENRFNEVIRNNNKFVELIKGKNPCLKYFNDFKDQIDNGALEYDNLVEK